VDLASKSTKSLMIFTTGLQSGGAEALLVRFVAVARDCGWRVVVVSMQREGFNDAAISELGVEFVKLHFTSGLGDLARIREARRLVRRVKPDVIQGWMYKGNMLATLAAAGTGQRAFWGIFCTPGNAWAGLAARLFYRALAWASRFSRGIVYNGQRARDEHERDGFSPHGAWVFYNGVDLQRFRSDPALREAKRAELGLAPGRVAVIVPARVHPQKDWANLVEAARLRPEVTFIAAGADTQTLPELPNLMRLGERTDMLGLYNAADLFALPSLFGEGTSVAMSEAMATGLPPIVTDVGDNAAIIGDAGVIVPISDPQQLAEAIGTLAADAGLRERLSARAESISRAKFDEQVTYRQLLDRYERS
jgi:Glycosyl transferases group 1/Glycosyltransferase Family 4